MGEGAAGNVRTIKCRARGPTTVGMCPVVSKNTDTRVSVTEGHQSGKSQWA